MGNDQGKEIIIKCEIGEMLKQFFKDSVIIWHDPNIDSPENKPFIAQLENLCQVKTFTRFEEVSPFIKQAKETCHVITSEMNIEEIYQEPNVSGVYIFGQNQPNFPPTNSKIICVETNITNLLFKVEKNLIQNFQEKASSQFSFAPIFNEADKKRLKTLHMYLGVIPTFKDRAQAKNDFLTLCKVLYSDEKSFDFILSLAQNYDQYDLTTILTMFTRQSLFPKVLNACLRISSSDALQYCRLPLQDMQRAIRECYHNKSKGFSGLLYQTVYIAEEEWTNIKDNLNKEIETLGFVLTSKDLPSALNFMQIDPNKNTLITILVPKGPNTEEYGFAEIDFGPNPLQVVFNTRSRFTILEANEKYSQDLPYRHLVLIYGTQGFRKYLAGKNPIQKVVLGNTKKIKCDFCRTNVLQISLKFFFKSLTNHQNNYCQECLHKIPPTNKTPFLCVPVANTQENTQVIQGCFLTYPQHLKIPLYGHKCCQENPKVHFNCTECNDKWCENCLDKTENCIQLGHSIIMETVPFSFWHEWMTETELEELQFERINTPLDSNPDRQGDMFLHTHEYEKALDYNLKLLKSFKEKNRINNAEFGMGSLYQKIARIYALKQDHRKSLEYNLKAYDLYKSLGQDTDPKVLPLLHSIGTKYYNLGELSLAQEYFSKAIDLSILAKGNNHPGLAVYYSSLGATYILQGQVQKGLECSLKAFELSKEDPFYCLSLGRCYLTLGDYKKAEEYCIQMLDIIKAIPGEPRYNFAVCYNLFGEIYEAKGNYKKAEEYHLKTFEIHQENDPEKQNNWNSMGRLYQIKGDYNKAIEFHFKALESIHSLYGENHMYARGTYTSLARAYCHKGDYSEALEYCSKALKISILTLGEDYQTFGKIYEKKGEYNQALDCYLKAEESLRALYGKNHPEMVKCYCDIGNAYNHLGEYEKAVEYHFRALQMTEIVFEENKNHPNLANSYSGLGQIYCKKKEYKMAMEYHLKSLNIRKEIHGENHPDVAVCYADMGDVYKGEGDDEKAKESYSKALEIRKLMLGDKHPETIAIQEKIGGDEHPETMAKQEKIEGDEDSETIARQEKIEGDEYTIAKQEKIEGDEYKIAKQEKIEGDEDSETIAKQEKIEGDEHPVIQEKIEGDELPETGTTQEKIGGDEHPEIIAIQEKIEGDEDSETIARQEKIEGNEDSETIAKQKKVEEDDHPETMAKREKIEGDEDSETTATQEKIGGDEDPETMAIKKKIEGDEHPEAIAIQEKVERDEDPETMVIKKKIEGDEHPETIVIQEKIGGDEHTIAKQEKIEGDEDPETIAIQEKIEEISQVKEDQREAEI